VFREAAGVGTGGEDYRVRMLARRRPQPESSPLLNARRWQSYVAANRRRWKGHLPKDREVRILDVGCGDGAFVKFLQEEGYRNARGFDADAVRIDRGQTRGVRGIFTADLRRYFRESECIGCWDMILVLNVIEHLTKQEVLDLLGDVYQSLRPGGVVWIRTPNAAGLFGGYTRYIEFTHENAFTTSSLREVLDFVGFEGIQFRPWGPMPHGLRSICRYVGWKGVEAILRLVSILEVASDRGGIFTADFWASAKRPGDDG